MMGHFWELEGGVLPRDLLTFGNPGHHCNNAASSQFLVRATASSCSMVASGNDSTLRILQRDTGVRDRLKARPTDAFWARMQLGC